MRDRRTTGRREIKLFVDHILSERERCLCVSEDLSAEGMRISQLPGQGWAKGQHAWLQFHLPDGPQPIRALGELRGEGDHSRSFRFKYINPQARRRFEAYLNG
ncbi:PilZ domain-containing protein [Myxococcota bacterium]|nr:PilZ domain-containing protein [Myxococcota bacterium]MBU1431310.1 PilZ domain-containing protein [Myxococcota bacterium]MBU1898926.1 PilZ domain-containing protein [Myxococcota bacterium]